MKLGKKQTEIADIMQLQIKTINKHVMEIKETFKVTTIAELMIKVGSYL